jgi:hypothetical protein
MNRRKILAGIIPFSLFPSLALAETKPRIRKIASWYWDTPDLAVILFEDGEIETFKIDNLGETSDSDNNCVNYLDLDSNIATFHYGSVSDPNTLFRRITAQLS